jgi:hypothetical protein
VADRADRDDAPHDDSLVAFLLARLADDERTARATPSGRDGARVLREVAAKRAVVQIWLRAVRAQLLEHRDAGDIEPIETAVAHLATVYADHPDYRPGWRPGTGDRRDDRSGAGGERPDHPAGNVVPLWPGRLRHQHPGR